MQDAKLRHPLIALLLLVPAPTLGVVMAMLVLKDTALGKACWMFSKVWIVALPLLWLLLVDRSYVSLSPIPRDRRRAAIVAGMATGVVIFLLIIAGYLVFGRRWIDIEFARAHLVEVGLNRRWLYVVAALYWICVNSVIEEYVWRWFVYTRCAALMHAGAAVVVAGLAFTLHHVIALGLVFQWDWRVVTLASLGVFVGGVTWSILYAKYRSIWPGWISHAWADVAVFGVGYVILFG